MPNLAPIGLSSVLAMCAMLPLHAAELAPHQLQAKALYKELVEINTTHSVGDTTVAAQAMAKRLIAAGLPQEDVQVLVEVPRKGNLVARLRAKKPSGRKPILLLAHLGIR